MNVRALSLRARLILAMLALAAVGVIAVDVVTATALRGFLLERVDRSLVAAERDIVDRFVGPAGPGLGPTNYYAELRDRRGRVVRRVLPAFGYATVAPALSDATIEGVRFERRLMTVDALGGDAPQYRVLVDPLRGGGWLVVGLPLADLRATERRLFAIEAVVTVVVLVAIGLLAMWVVRIGLRPLTEIEQTAGAIAAGDLSRRVEETDEHTEVGRLGLAFNHMLEEIEAAFEQRRASEDRLRRFVADASHELRTPLTSIRGYAELFRAGAEERPEDLEKSMRRIEEEASRMGVLVEDLLLLARLDQGRPLERASVDARALFADAVDDLLAIEPGRPVTIEGDEALIVDGDELRLRQVAANLLENARAHTPEGTPVTVRTSRADGVAVIEVADQGPGMDEQTRARAFERFFRADPSRARTHGGSGLGLSIVSAIVAAHGGEVSVASEPGAGATFRIELPLAEETADHPV